MSNATSEFQFIPPPEAPVFKPTWEEFQDALGYINKIRPIAEQSGICKIIPPPDWQPPFAVDVDNFKFTPRIQRLNELEAHTRIKLNFLDQIAKFWELQGSSLKIPVVERKALDLYSLHKHVHLEGGAELVSRDRKWNKIAARMGVPANRNLGALLKSHYERIIHPYDIFNKGKMVSVKKEEEEEAGDQASVDKDYKPHKIPSRMAAKIPDSEKNGRRSRRYPDNQNGDSKCDSDGDEDGKGSKELKRLQFYGAGPKMAGFDTEGVPQGAAAPSAAPASAAPTQEEKGKTRGKKMEYYDYDPLAKYICLNCGRGDAEDQMLLCDGCDDSYHTFCLVPRLPEIPKGDWRCPKCVAVEVSKPLEAFGFEQAQKEYSLQSFGEMADKFKQDYFNMPVHLVPPEMAEREFWRIVSSIDEDVTVEYGADLHTMDHGSGFPTNSSKNLLPADQEYAVSSWNLNNLPIVEGSVLGHINCDISGMKVPWMYVGMCFSTFCWHNEDHWSYSINYLHWGEPKTWYGVAGAMAEQFEGAMRGAAPELFDAQPDLLHQLVTIMNPNIVMKAGVPIVRTDQHAGEFIITFPRSYHAGFNQGYNFAEAVNFCPPDWLSIGRECVVHYSNLKRYCVFSHDELVCKMAAAPEALDLTVAAATYQDLLKMVDLEKKLRRNLLQHGISRAEREAFELLPDDERQCDSCKTTCFLSAVTCACAAHRIACLRHYKLLCDCPPKSKTLRYRYTLDELPPMLQKLKVRAESFDNWAARVKAALEAKPEDKLDLRELRELVEEAESQKFPDNELLQTLLQAVVEADKCATVAAHLATKKVRTRTRGTAEAKTKLTLEELRLFHDQIESLACVIKEGDAVKELLSHVNDFRTQAQKVLRQEEPDSDLLTDTFEAGLALDIELPEIAQLKHRLKQVFWTEEVEDSMEEEETLTVEVIRRLLEEGISLPPSPKIERLMGSLQEVLGKVERWEEKAVRGLAAADALSIEEGEALLREAEAVPAHLASVAALKEAVKKAKEWVAKVEAFEGAEHAPLLETVESLVAKGRPVQLRLPALPALEGNVADAHAWLEKTARTFLKKTSQITLLEVLLPRTDIGVVGGKRKRVKKEELSPHQQLAQILDISPEDTANPSAVVKAYKDCEERELGAMRAIRSHNRSKGAGSEETPPSVCVCHKPPHGAMVTCCLCCDHFHVGCVPSYHRNKVKLCSEGRFICVSCERSQRPRLETILSLLVSLQKIPVRLPEAEALQCLTERAMLWQDKARTFLQTEEVSAALGKLSSCSQKLAEAQGKRKEALKKDPLALESNPEEEETAAEGGRWEHAYSSSRRTKGDVSALLASFGGGDGPLAPLPPAVAQQVQDLLVIGELLEVSLDENAHLWRVLQAASRPAALLEHTLLSIGAAGAAAPPQDDPRPRKGSQKKRKSEGAGDDGAASSLAKSPLKKFRSLMAGVKKKKVGAASKPAPKRRPRPKQQPATSSGRKGGPPDAASGSPSEEDEEGEEEDEEEEEEEEDECAAGACARPFGSNVEWVQCDGCDLWFHYVCVGLPPRGIAEEEEYLCRACCGGAQPKKPPGADSTPATGAEDSAARPGDALPAPQ